MANPSYKDGNVLYVSLKNASGADISVGEFVYDNSGTLTKAGDGTELLGIAHEDIPNGETGVVEIPLGAVYGVDAASGTDFALLDSVALASSTTVDKGGGSDPIVGYVVGKDPASGGRAFVCLLSTWMRLDHSADQT